MWFAGSKKYGTGGYKCLVSVRTCAPAHLRATAVAANMVLTQFPNLAEDALHSLQSQPLRWTAGLVGLYILHAVSSH